jgi:hypothetical protein
MYSVKDNDRYVSTITTRRQERNKLKFLVGKNDWLYLDNDTNRTLDQITGNLVFDPKKLFKWKLILETRYSFLKAQGIEYFFLVAPNKECIYSEDLPDNIKISEQRTIKQLSNYISSSKILPDDFLLYPIEELITARSNRLTYPKGDTHWTFYGAYIAYQAMARRIAKQIDLNIIDESKINFEEIYISGDLAEKIPGYPPYLDYKMNCKKSSQCVYNNLVNNTGRLTIWENSHKNLPKAVLFHDSFSLTMFEFWAESFSRLVTVQQPNLDYEIIAQEQPDLVISEQVERFLVHLPDDLNGLNNREQAAKKVEAISRQYTCQHINMQSENSQLLYAWCLGSPKPGKSDIYNLRGWVIGKDLPVAKVELINLDTDRIIKETPVNIFRPGLSDIHPVPNANSSGFLVQIPEMVAVFEEELPTYHLLIRAVLSDGQIIPIRMLKFTRN